MRLILGLTAMALMLTPSSLAQEETTEAAAASPEQTSQTAEQAATMLRESAQAIKAVKAAVYDFTVKPTGFLEQQMPAVEGTAKLVRKESAEKSMCRFQAMVTMPEGAEGSGEFVFATSGEQAFLIVHPEREFLHGVIGEGGEQLLGFAELVIMPPLIAASPYEEELNDVSLLSLDGTREVGSVTCDVVVADFGPSGQSRWFIAQKTRLPAGFERRMPNPMNPQETTSMTLLAADLTTADSLPTAEFTLEAPEDYTAQLMEAPAPPEALEEGATAPTWSLETPAGESVSLASLKGNVVVMDFWATWCGPCKRAMPGLQALHEKYKDKPVKIIGINVWEDGDPVEFMEENEYTYPILLEGDEVATEYKVSGIPTFYVIGPQGKIIHVSIGFDPEGEEKLSEVIDEALKEIGSGG